jgi:hypothetical protein
MSAPFYPHKVTLCAPGPSGAALGDTTIPTTPTPSATGGLSNSRTISAATTNATVVKATPGKVHRVIVSNINAAARYLKLYNKATAPTVGTDVPVITLLLPAASQQQLDLSDLGLQFSAGIGFALTTGVADADVAAVSANEHVVNILYA